MRLWEWYLELPPAGPGQGTDWGLESEPVWSGVIPTWVTALVLAGLVAGVIAVYLRDAKSLSWPARSGLILLRLAGLAVLLAMLARLVLTVTHTGLPTLAVLIDTSASMGLDDRYQDEAAAGASRLQSADGVEITGRLGLVQGLLSRDGGRFLQELSSEHHVRLYQFGGTIEPIEISAADSEGATDALVAAIRQLRPTADESRPAAAVRQVLDVHRGNAPAAMIIMTDGIPTTSNDDALPSAVPEARRRSVPLIPIGVGSDEPTKDLQLYDVLAEDLIFVDDPITFAFQLKGFGFNGETATISLRQQGRPGVLQTVDVAVGRDGHSVSAEVTHVPTEEGEVDYIIEANELPGETNAGNNSVTHRVQVRREQLRVLLVERLPRWEFRHLKPLLERDPAIELYTVLQQADVGFADEDRTALQRFPVSRDALMTYDVIIWGDVDLSFLSPGAMDHLQEFVTERGGGLILIAGERHNPHSYRDTPLEDLLPVEPGVPESSQAQIAVGTQAGFRPELTVDGRTRSALRLADTTEQSERVWRQLPPLYWLQESGRRQPAAQVLAVHPTRHGDGGQLPVIVMQRMGAGQVLYHATDEFWQWRRRVEDRHYGRYWLQMVRYLSRSKLRSGAQGIELTTDRSIYQQGETVEIRARFLDPRTVPTTDEGAMAVIEGPGGQRDSVTLSRLAEAPSIFAGRISQLTAGSYHAWLSEPAPLLADEETQNARLTIAVPSTDFRVQVPENELRDRAFRRADLIEAAKGSRGRFYPFWDTDRLLQELPPGRAVPVSSEMRIPLWNRWEFLVLLASLLAAEWIIRKRAGLV